MIQGSKPLTEQELEIGNNLYNKRIEYLIELGKIKLSEIENERNLEDVYFNITELNTREEIFQQDMFNKYGQGQIDLINKVYIKGS